MRPATLRRYATEAGFRGVDVLPIETANWRFYPLAPRPARPSTRPGAGPWSVAGEMRLAPFEEAAQAFGRVLALQKAGKQPGDALPRRVRPAP